MRTSTNSGPLSLSSMLGTILAAVAMATVVRATVTSGGRASSRPGCSKMETYNVGLMSFVDETNDRVHRIVEALKASQSDFLCIQEAWMEKYVSLITEGVASEFPHHFSPIHEAKDVLRGPDTDQGWFSMKDTACSMSESIKVYSVLVSCAVINGCFSSGTSPISMGVCVTTNCHQLLKSSGIRDNCVSCVFINSGRKLSDGVTQCSLPQDRHNRMNGPGLVVLSRHNMVNATFTNFFPNNRMIASRGYITAELESGITAVCTHLSPNLDHHGYLEYDTGFGSYSSQQIIEINSMIETMKGSDAVILGDMNTGPAVTHDTNPQENVEAELPENFALLMDGGYRSPFMEEDGRCTFCTSNPLAKDSPNAQIDHILIKKDTALTVSDVQRLYDKSDPPLSDHYGVGLQVCRGGRSRQEEGVCEAGSKDCTDG